MEENRNQSKKATPSCCSAKGKKPMIDFSIEAPISTTKSPTKKASCCSTKNDQAAEHTVDASHETSSCCDSAGTKDILLMLSLVIVVISYIGHWFFHSELASVNYAGTFCHGVYSMMNKMWWGLAIGIITVGFLGHVPKEFIQSIIGKGGTVSGIIRATGAGLLLDLCNHGILLVAMKLYERGASLGQTLAFLIASPWNSLSLTLILVGLIGLKYTLLFILLSGVIAIVTGLITDKMVIKHDPKSQLDLSNFSFFKEMKKGLKNTKFNLSYFKATLLNGFKDSRSLLKWIFLGAIAASCIRTFVSPENFEAWFGASIAGIFLTLGAATIIEVCSEGSSPIAAELVTTAKAPGNAFTFLMAGASTDYTEIMVLKETTKSWRKAFILPLLTLPQVIALGILINIYSV